MSDPFEDATFIPAEVVVEDLPADETSSDQSSEQASELQQDTEQAEADPDGSGGRSSNLGEATEVGGTMGLGHGGRKEPGDIQTVALRVPLFVLTAPDVAGCKTTMTSGTSGSLGWALELKLFGNGISLGKKVTVSWSHEVSVGAGRANEIFLPVWVDVQEFTTYFDDGREERVTFEVTLRRGDQFKNRVGVRTLTEWVAPNGRRAELLDAQLADQSPDDDPVEMSFEYKSESTGEVSIGFDAFGAEQTVKVEATKTRSHELTAALKPGHNYQGQGGVWPPYLAWKVGS